MVWGEVMGKIEITNVSSIMIDTNYVWDNGLPRNDRYKTQFSVTNCEPLGGSGIYIAKSYYSHESERCPLLNGEGCTVFIRQ